MKKEVRKRIIAKRMAMKGEEVSEKSWIICRRLVETEEYKKAKNICLYMAVNNEVDLGSLVKTAWNDGKFVWLPRIWNGRMDFHLYTEGTPLLEGDFGIPEPLCCTMHIPTEETLVVMPGVAFSNERDRIGYGGGYYDRYLERYPMCETVAVAYELQVVKEIFSEEHDIKPKRLITEKNIY